MNAPRSLGINVESVDGELDNRTATAADLGNDLLEQAQQAESGQAALLDTTGLESRYSETLEEYLQAKQDQVERIEDRLENLIEQEMASLEDYQAHRPAGLFLRPGRRAAWEQGQAKRQATIQRLQNRLEHVREIKEDMGLHGPKIEELAVRKLRMKEPDLAKDWDALCTAQRHHETLQRMKAQDRERSQTLSRVRFLNVSRESR